MTAIVNTCRVEAHLDFADIMRAVAQVKGERSRAFRARHGDSGAALALRPAWRYAVLALRELGDVIGGLDYAAVSVAIKRNQ